MKKTIVIAVLSILATLSASKVSAQNRFEIGVNYAPYENFSAADDIPNMLYKFGAYGEYRWQWGQHFDVAARIDAKAGPIGYYEKWNKKTSYYGFSISGDVLAAVDFNLLPDKAVNPFIGLGLGPGFGMHNDTLDNLFSGRFYIYTDLRAGLELFRHLRISVDYSVPLLSEMFTTLNANVGRGF